ncbi:hypothetical protein XENTR_v10017004 [Xenopus tropicalis]|nr:hypothetical protein XENTR_v10017004 [Xenopus tropicalis]
MQVLQPGTWYYHLRLAQFFQGGRCQSCSFPSFQRTAPEGAQSCRNHKNTWPCLEPQHKARTTGKSVIVESLFL